MGWDTRLLFGKLEAANFFRQGSSAAIFHAEIHFHINTFSVAQDGILKALMMDLKPAKFIVIVYS